MGKDLTYILIVLTSSLIAKRLIRALSSYSLNDFKTKKVPRRMNQKLVEKNRGALTRLQNPNIADLDLALKQLGFNSQYRKEAIKYAQSQGATTLEDLVRQALNYKNRR